MADGTKLIFKHYIDNNPANALARMEIPDSGIQFNMSVENILDMRWLKECNCVAEIKGLGYNVVITHGGRPALMSIMPVGTHTDKISGLSFLQTPHIIFSGVITAVEDFTRTRQEGVNFGLHVQTLGMQIRLFIKHEGRIRPGDTITGTAVLYGIIEPTQ